MIYVDQLLMLPYSLLYFILCVRNQINFLRNEVGVCIVNKIMISRYLILKYVNIFVARFSDYFGLHIFVCMIYLNKAFRLDLNNCECRA